MTYVPNGGKTRLRTPDYCNQRPYNLMVSHIHDIRHQCHLLTQLALPVLLPGSQCIDLIARGNPWVINRLVLRHALQMLLEMTFG